MKGFFQIVIFMLSWTMFTSSLVAYTTIPSSSHEMTCCTEIEDESSICHTSEHSDKKEHQCEGNCPTHDCCTHTSVFKNLVQINSSQNSEEIQIIVQKNKSDFYRSGNIQDFTFAFWNPPQFVV